MGAWWRRSEYRRGINEEKVLNPQIFAGTLKEKTT